MSQLPAITDEADLFDKIEQYYRGGAQLLPKEREQCERWELAFGLFLEHRTRKVAVSKFISLQKAKGNEISVSTAYRDFANAEKIFLPLQKYSKEFLRMTIIESALRDIRKADDFSKRISDPKDWATIMDIKHKAEIRIVKAAGLELDDPNLPDFSKIQLSQININVDDRVKKLFDAMLNKGTVDVSEVMEKMSDDETILDN